MESVTDCALVADKFFLVTIVATLDNHSPAGNVEPIDNKRLVTIWTTYGSLLHMRMGQIFWVFMLSIQMLNLPRFVTSFACFFVIIWLLIINFVRERDAFGTIFFGVVMLVARMARDTARLFH